MELLSRLSLKASFVNSGVDTLSSITRMLVIEHLLVSEN